MWRPAQRRHRPRRRGLATRALGRLPDEARRLGLEQVLIVCAADNIASAKMIEYHGGVLEGIRDTELGPARRYWIKAPAHQPAFPGPSGKLHPVVDPRLRVVHAVRTSAAIRAP